MKAEDKRKGTRNQGYNKKAEHDKTEHFINKSRQKSRQK